MLVNLGSIIIMSIFFDFFFNYLGVKEFIEYREHLLISVPFPCMGDSLSFFWGVEKRCIFFLFFHFYVCKWATTVTS